MARLIWSPRAVADLEAICSFISVDSEYYAKLFAARIIKLAEQISDFPEAGRIVPEYGSATLRERVLHSYRVIYRIKDDCAQIVAVIHGARMLPDMVDVS